MANETKPCEASLQNRIATILARDDYREFGELFYETLTSEMESDGEAWDKKGAQILRAVMMGDMEGVFLALCGWSVPTLIGMAEDRAKEESEDDDE